MKKLITLLLAGMLCVTAAACSGSQKSAETESAATNDTAQISEAKDLIVSEKYYNVKGYDEEHPELRKSNTVTTYEYEFDGEGHPIKTTRKTDGTLERVEENVYDDAGNVIKQTAFDADGNKAFSFKYEYDDNNNKTGFTTYNAEDSVSSVISYEYDENGNLISESVQLKDHAYSTRYENDKEGKVLTSFQYNQDGNEIVKTDWEYDSDGRLIRKNNTYPNGSEPSYVEYEYDDRGNAVKEVSYGADGTIHYSFERVYKTVKELMGD